MRRSGPKLAAWLDDQQPHNRLRSMSQIDGLLKMLGRPPKRVLDLGCGAGRIVVPLAAAGHRVTGMDVQASVLERCSARLNKHGATATLIQEDFTRLRNGRLKADAVLCLGNTFMTIVDVDDAVILLRRIAKSLSPRGWLAFDDFPHELWTELTDGNWLSGISTDGGMQLVWQPGDAVFALRRGSEVDRRCWSIKPSDRRLRLWCEGSLRLAAKAAGLSAPRRVTEAGLIIMRGQRGRTGRH
jgi:SAM-dependent methyltransferase